MITFRLYLLQVEWTMLGFIPSFCIQMPQVINGLLEVRPCFLAKNTPSDLWQHLYFSMPLLFCNISILSTVSTTFFDFFLSYFNSHRHFRNSCAILGCCKLMGLREYVNSIYAFVLIFFFKLLYVLLHVLISSTVLFCLCSFCGAPGQFIGWGTWHLLCIIYQWSFVVFFCILFYLRSAMWSRLILSVLGFQWSYLCQHRYACKQERSE